jgi:hypothetical protein
VTDDRGQKSEVRKQRSEAGGKQRTDERMHVDRRAVPLMSEISSKSSGRIAVENHLVLLFTNIVRFSGTILINRRGHNDY